MEKIIRKEKMFCSICGEEHEVDLCEKKVIEKVKDEDVEFVEHYYKCDKFEDENTFMVGEMWNESLVNSLDAYREKKNLLTSKEIKKIRAKYDLTQAELALLMGLGEITVTRYETKQIQDRSNDNMLREISNNSILTLKLLEKNKEKFSEKRFLEMTEKIKDIIDSEMLSFLNEQEILAKYIKFDDENLFNGNKILDIEKLSSVLAYIAKQMKQVKKVVLMKMLWYIDSLNYQKNDISMTGLVYQHMPYGALPIAYDEIIKLPSVKYEVVDDENFEYKIYYNKEYKIVGLSKDEKEIIDEVIDKFKNYSSSKIADYMHNETAYKETKQGEIISFDYAKKMKKF